MVSRCFPGGYNVKLYISTGGLAWWLLAFLHSEAKQMLMLYYMENLHILVSYVQPLKCKIDYMGSFISILYCSFIYFT